MIQTQLPPLNIKGKSLLPIIQGGMGVGVSGHRLAGHVAHEGAIGTIASVDLRVLHKDLWARGRRVRDKAVIDALNLEALDREIKSAKKIANGKGMIAVNVMKAVDMHASLVRQACESGADAIIMGAGLPLDLPDMVEGYDDVALIPILSEERGVRAVLKKWLRKGRRPDAIVIEHPRYAGGHLGATRLDEVDSARFDFSSVFEKIFAIFEQLGIDKNAIPLIAAGGVNSTDKLHEILAMGGSGAQIGTPFAVTQEGDAHPNFKQVLLNARPKDIVTFMSTAGLPARAVLTPWLKRYLKREEKRRFRACPERGTCALGVECLTHCGLKDGNPNSGQFCIDLQLQAAVRGNVDKGLFFRGSESLPLGDRLASVRELLEYYLMPGKLAM
ncbi:MAG: nitronate monooxygenase family protein [Granulosicoccaceae bacterium]|jgi:nitronate monooxygenase